MSAFTTFNTKYIECTTGFSTSVLDEYISTFNVPVEKVPDFVAALIMTALMINCAYFMRESFTKRYLGRR